MRRPLLPPPAHFSFLQERVLTLGIVYVLAGLAERVAAAPPERRRLARGAGGAPAGRRRDRRLLPGRDQGHDGASRHRGRRLDEVRQGAEGRGGRHGAGGAAGPELGLGQAADVRGAARRSSSPSRRRAQGAGSSARRRAASSAAAVVAPVPVVPRPGSRPALHPGPQPRPYRRPSLLGPSHAHRPKRCRLAPPLAERARLALADPAARSAEQGGSRPRAEPARADLFVVCTSRTAPSCAGKAARRRRRQRARQEAVGRQEGRRRRAGQAWRARCAPETARAQEPGRQGGRHRAAAAGHLHRRRPDQALPQPRQDWPRVRPRPPPPPPLSLSLRTAADVERACLFLPAARRAASTRRTRSGPT